MWNVKKIKRNKQQIIRKYAKINTIERLNYPRFWNKGTSITRAKWTTNGIKSRFVLIIISSELERGRLWEKGGFN